jgi:hypothetical protein
VIKKIGYNWHLRRVMADRGLFQTTELVPLIEEKRGPTLAGARVSTRDAQPPQRLSMDTLAALCDILDCQVQDLIEITRQ